MNDIQVIASFCISLLGVGLMFMAFFELTDGELGFDESDDEDRLL